jgi:hypothetical protein
MCQSVAQRTADADIGAQFPTSRGPTILHLTRYPSPARIGCFGSTSKWSGYAWGARAMSFVSMPGSVPGSVVVKATLRDSLPVSKFGDVSGDTG